MALFCMIILFSLITLSFGTPETDDLIGNHQITHPSSKCNGKTVTNKFDARISKVKSGQSYKGTFLVIPGGQAMEYVGHPDYATTKAGQQKLMNKLYDIGFRILEIRWKYSVTDNTRYDNAYSCSMYGVSQALQVLKDQNIGSSSNKWWPSSYLDRFAIGTSSGQIALQFAVDKWTMSFTRMNRVIYGGGESSYDLFDVIDCTEANSSIPLEKVNFMYSGAETKCKNDATCDGDTALADALDEASLKNYIGTSSDDASRAEKVLFNTGNDWGCNHDMNEDYWYNRLGTEGTDKRIWDLEGTWCSLDIHGHAIINTVYDERSGDTVPDVDEWFNFIKDGTMAASVACPE
eukprot:445182_1